MTTGYPIIEQIAQAVKTRLETVTTANGYQQTLTIKRPTRQGTDWTPEHNLVLLSHGDASRNADYEYEANPMVYAWDQQFAIEIFQIPSEDDTAPIEQLANVVLADVITALTDPDETWHEWRTTAADQSTRLAVFSYIADVSMLVAADGSLQVTEITLVITYRTPFNDPYTVA